MPKTVKWGVLGNAWIARDYMIPAMRKSERCELVAIASRKELPADFLPDLRHYASYEEMLGDPAIEAVYIPTPNALHAPWAEAAMRQGKHVLCEKPLTMDAKECESLMKTAEACGVLLMEAFMYRYSEKTRILLEVLDSGVLGAIRGVSATHGYMLDWASPARQDVKLGGGCLYDVGCYCVDYLNMVMAHCGAKPVHASASMVLAGGVDVHTAGIVTYSNGVAGSITCWFDGAPHQQAAVFGEKGVLIVPNAFDDEADATIELITAEGTQTFTVTPCDNYQREADAFSEAVLGLADRRHPLDATLDEMRVLDMLYTHK